MAQTRGLQTAPEPVLPARVSWWFLAAGCALTAAASLSGSGGFRSFAYAGLAVLGGGAAVWGILRNRPARRGAWLLMALGVTLSAAGDVVYDLAIRGFGVDPYPYADVFYLSAYPCFAVALWRLAGRRGRETTADSAIVALAAAAVVWQWVISPVLGSTGGATLERLVTVLYPAMDVVLLIALVHAIFLLPRWITAARLLFAGFAVMLLADVLFARFTADGTYEYAGSLDALWPVAYLLLAGAMLHPSMRELWDVGDAGLVRTGRARVAVLATALFSVPALVVIGGATNDEAIALTAIVAATAMLVAWRIARLVTEANQAREEIGESESRFRALVQHSSDATAVIDQFRVITYVAPAVREMLGYEAHEMIGRPVSDFVHPGDEAPDAIIDRLVAHPFATERIEARVRHKDGSWRWLDGTCTNQLEEPAVRGIVGNFRDVTERKRMEHAGLGETRVLELILRGAPVEETLHALLHTVEDFLGDSATIVRLVDPETRTLSSVAAPTLPLSYLRRLDEGPEGSIDAFADAVNLSSESVIVPDMNVDGPGAELRELALAYGLVSFWSFPIRARESDAPLGYLGVYTRVRRTPRSAEYAVLTRARDLVSLALDRAAHTQQLGFLALHDTLTELPNRALGGERLASALKSLPDSGPMVAALFLDLDRFKVVNDGLGHDTGDELLVAVGRRLAGSVRRQDTVARFGGDEFVIICEQLRDEHHAVELTERVLDALSAPFSLARSEVVVSASIGIALTDRATDRASDLLRDADAAMYRAKSRGGGRYELFDQAMHTQAVARLLTERALRQSLEHDELRVQFQPQFDLLTGERVASEALLRWAHPVRGLVAPGDFMAVAEETGLIVPIGEWVLEEVCHRAELAQLDSDADLPLPVSMNVSARQLFQSDFVEHVRRTLARHELEPHELCVEVPERVLLDDHEPIRESLHALKDLGVRLAIDDFGTGGSSLTYLRRYPFDELKIDGTFVAGLERSPADDAIVAATIDMAHALGMTTAAEGIESEAQRVRLVELGCERGQGYHLAGPESGDARHLRLVGRRPA
jgi:diguanylate cyclase (GGDEF)-like protein/PAS domain S-box-containing protein